MASQDGKKKNGKASDFDWTDDEIQLLLKVCFDFKAESDYEGVDWESKRTKYEQIKSKFCEQYLEVEDEKFPRSNDLDSITKERISAKLKSIRTNFRKAVDTGKSRGGRIILFYKLCERIWGGCPAVNSISHGIDTSTPKEKTQENEPMQNELQNEEDEDDDKSSSVQSNSLLSKYDETGIGSPTSGEEIREAQSLKEQTTKYRKKVGQGFKNKRDKKLSSKLSMDTQLLNISKEELSLKRKLVEQLEKSEEEFNSGSSCIQQTVGILAYLINQQQTPYQQQYQPLFSPPSFNHQSVSKYGHPSERNVQNKNQGNEENERVMKRTTIVLISTSSVIYI